MPRRLKLLKSFMETEAVRLVHYQISSGAPGLFTDWRRRGWLLIQLVVA
jgi:hypothetical protein